MTLLYKLPCTFLFCPLGLYWAAGFQLCTEATAAVYHHRLSVACLAVVPHLRPASCSNTRAVGVSSDAARVKGLDTSPTAGLLVYHVLARRQYCMALPLRAARPGNYEYGNHLGGYVTL